MKMMKGYVFNITQLIYKPGTLDIPLLTEENIKSCITHRTIKRWAYIKHDEDVYSEEDERKDKSKKAGSKKPAHWHIVIEMKSNQTAVATIAKWLGIPEQYVAVAKGRGAFLDCVQYLTHERENQQEQGKRLYADNRVVSNFDFRQELNNRAEKIAKYGKDALNRLEEWIFDVNHGYKSLGDCYKEDPILFGKNYNTLKKNRQIYLETLRPPTTRINIYITGRRKDGTAGGIGKSLASRAIARSLVKAFTGRENLADEEIFFIVGSRNVTFEGYDGQPVIIWDDCKAITLLQKLGSRENIYNVFDPRPSEVMQFQNVKYGRIPMVQRINIINSAQERFEFLDALAGEYVTKDGQLIKGDDKTQVYRRIPILMELREEDYDLAFLRGFLYGTDDFMTYEETKRIQANFRKIREYFKGQQAIQLESQATQILTDKVVGKLKEDESLKSIAEGKLEEFKYVGSVKEEPEG